MNILLVEDSRVLRDRLRRFIGELPRAVLVGETDNEADALRYLETYRPDTLVLDLRLKSGSGLSVLEWCKARYPDITIVILSNYGQAEYRGKCLGLGADHFFDKTRDHDAFGRCLSALCDGAGAPLSTSNTGVLP
jgi:two-component system OmpR family response regulator